MTDLPAAPGSPKWGSSTKMVVGFTVVAFVAGLLIYFRQIIGPLLIAFILSFLLHPLANRLKSLLNVSWRTAVNLIYLLLVILLGILFTLTGLAIIQQGQNLISFIERFAIELPDLVETIPTQIYTIGRFEIDFSQFDLAALAERLLATLQPLLGQAGSLLSKFATSAITTLGWGLFVLLVSYFLLSESGTLTGNLVNIDIPGYNEDLRRLGRQLGIIWDAFLRGQLVISILVVISYYILLNILGTRSSLAIALMAGLARFVPYVGPLTVWTITAIVAFVQPSNYFGLEPFFYALLVLVACLILDQIYDNLVSPRILGHSLGVHPAGVLIAAIVVAQLIGILGLVLAAPMLATLNLVGRYVLRKLFDQDPWPESEPSRQPIKIPWGRFLGRLRAWWRRFTSKPKINR